MDIRKLNLFLYNNKMSENVWSCIKSVLDDEEGDPIVRMQLEDLLLMATEEEQEEVLFKTYMEGSAWHEYRMSLRDVFSSPVSTCCSSVAFDLEDIKENINPNNS